MAEELKSTRLKKAATDLNVGIATILEFLRKKGFKIDENPNAKISPEILELLIKEFQTDRHVKEEAMKIGLSFGSKHESVSIDDKGSVKTVIEEPEAESEEIFIKGVGIDEPPPKEKKAAKKEEAPKKEEKAVEQPAEKEPKAKEKPAVDKKEEKEVEKQKAGEAVGEEKGPKLKIIDKIDLPDEKKKKKDKKAQEEKQAKKEEKKEEKVPEKAEAVKEEEVAIVTEEKDKKTEEKKEPPKKDQNFIPTKVEKLVGPSIVGKIDLPKETPKSEKKPVASSGDQTPQVKKKKRKRIRHEKADHDGGTADGQEKEKGRGKRKKERVKPEVSEEEVQKQIRETLARLGPAGKSKASKHRRLKRETISQQMEAERQKAEEDKKVLKVTEFVTVNEVANMMNVAVNEIISTFMQLGMFVSINQRLDAESLALVAEEFGYKLEFVSYEVQEVIGNVEADDASENTEERPPIVTVMGHVDHGKTKLLDYIRNANVVAGEAGGITQHIGAYEVTLENEKKITFLDTPGHEAFTAMRARGAEVTDVAIIVVAADDNVMPQTVEAINHAQAAGVPIVFAINKIDKPTADPEKIKEELSKMNILVEDWGGKYQSQEISAKQGLNVDLLLEKVLLEAELLELKANPDRLAVGTVIESSLEKGRGYVTKVLVQNGTLKNSDIVLAGSHFGKVKAMYNERNQRVNDVGPSSPVLLLGMDGAPQAGDKFHVMKDEREAKAIANKRLQLQREQGIRSQKHITLDEIGRRIAIGDFKELNLIVKGDVDGSVEALSDALLKLSTNEVQVNIIHKSVGQVTESDVLLASASNAIIVGFQVRPSVGARKLAEKEEIEIRNYSIIYQAIEEIKSAIEGMLSPQIEEKITSNIEVREVFKISKVGTVAGCMVLDGKITRQTKVRIIRDGIVVYTGKLGSLKRFKDDAKEVSVGMECGLNIENFNDIKVGDIIEGYEEIEVKRTL